MDQVGFDGWNNVIDDFALEGEGNLQIGLLPVAVDTVLVVEDAVFGQMDAVVRQLTLIDQQLVVDETADVHMEHFPVVGKGHVHIRPELVEGRNQRCGDIGEAACLGRKLVGHVPHAFGQVGDFRRDDQYARFLSFFSALRSHVQSLFRE